jgi:predicted PurR-regulated permease PerM
MTNPIIKYIINNHFLATLILVVLCWLAVELSGVLVLIFISYIIMSALAPFTIYLVKKHFPRILAVAIPYAITITILVLLIFPLIPFLISQIQLLFANLPKYAEQVAKIFNFHIDPSSLGNVFGSDLNFIGKSALNVTSKIFSGVFSTLTVFVISFYLMFQRKILKKQFMSLLPQKYQNNALKTLIQIENKIGLWLRGQLILSFVIGFCVWGGLSLLGLPYALPLGLTAGLLEIVPTIGPIISAIPSVIVALTISPALAITVIIFYILLQMLENNLLVPKIMEKAVGLNPIIIIVGVLIGSKFLGVLGALLAVPFIALIIIIAKSFKSLE